MGEQTCQGTGSGPALYCKRVLIGLTVMIDPVRPLALPGLLAMAHEHDNFRSRVMICHFTPRSFIERRTLPAPNSCCSEFLVTLLLLADELHPNFAHGSHSPYTCVYIYCMSYPEFKIAFFHGIPAFQHCFLSESRAAVYWTLVQYSGRHHSIMPSFYNSSNIAPQLKPETEQNQPLKTNRHLHAQHQGIADCAAAARPDDILDVWSYREPAG